MTKKDKRKILRTIALQMPAPHKVDGQVVTVRANYRQLKKLKWLDCVKQFKIKIDEK